MRYPKDDRRRVDRELFMALWTEHGGPVLYLPRLEPRAIGSAEWAAGAWVSTDPKTRSEDGRSRDRATHVYHTHAGTREGASTLVWMQDAAQRTAAFVAGILCESDEYGIAFDMVDRASGGVRVRIPHRQRVVNTPKPTVSAVMKGAATIALRWIKTWRLVRFQAQQSESPEVRRINRELAVAASAIESDLDEYVARHITRLRSLSPKAHINRKAALRSLLMIGARAAEQQAKPKRNQRTR